MKLSTSALLVLVVIAQCIVAYPLQRKDLDADDPFFGFDTTKESSGQSSEDVFRGPYPSSTEARSLSADGRGAIKTLKEARCFDEGDDLTVDGPLLGYFRPHAAKCAEDDLSADGPFRGLYLSSKEARSV
ncbi:hypothetical protein EIP91_009356 [Steccherinum ochraceum]|uniref:Uncharacterized protein n=1 Tax=Steccherinum ochraceum TaxID=92696 RepID=A0A4R0RMU8_9APHY|nr:hypothetical protein EIP91_009356 [Steccherinum ochraceum]